MWDCALEHISVTCHVQEFEEDGPLHPCSPPPPALL